MGTKVFSPFALADPTSTINGVKEATIFDIVAPNVVEPSYLFEATQFILEMDREFASAKKELYISITESEGNREIVHESFTEFVGKIKNIIRKFLDFIKRLFDKFITKLNGIVKSEKYLEKHKADFSKFTTDDEFDFKGYNFTIDEVPLNIKIFKDFEQDVQNLRNTLDSITDNDKTSIMKAADDAYENLMGNLDEYFWKFRGEVIGTNNTIEDSDYADELFKVFRNGDFTSETITADSAYIIKALNRTMSFDKTTKSVERDKKNLEKDYSALEKAVEKFSKMKFDDSTKNYKATLNYGDDSSTPTTREISSEAKTKIDLFVSKKAEQIQKCANIHTMAFAAKLDALKEEYRQNKAVLYKALSKIQKILPKKEDAELSSNDYISVTIPIDIPTDDCCEEDGSSIEDILRDTDGDILDSMVESKKDIFSVEDYDMSLFTKLKDSFKFDDSLTKLMNSLDGDINKVIDAVGIENQHLCEACEDGILSESIIAIMENNTQQAMNFARRTYQNKISNITDINKLNTQIAKYEAKAKKYYSIRDKRNSETLLAKLGRAFIVGAMFGLIGVPAVIYMNDANNYKIAADNYVAFAKMARARKAELQRGRKINKENSVENYSSMNIYNNYIIERALIHDESINIIKECLIFANSENTPSIVIEELNMLNEGKIADGAKAIFEKLKTFLNTIWQKFSEKAMKLFASDKAYLTKYKDTILKTKPQDGLKYEMPDHEAGIKAIQSSTIQVLRYNDQAKAELDKGLISYLNGIVPNLNLKDDSDYNSALKNMFINGTTDGGTKEYLATQLNWTDIYNYCMNYQTMVNEIEKAKTIILQSHNEAEKIINELEKEEDKNKPADGTTNEAYSMILGKYITEADANKVSIKAPENNSNPPASTGGTTNTGKPENSLAKNTNTVAGNEKPEDADAAKQKADQDKELARKAIGAEIEKARDHCKVYFDAVNAIIAAKMTAIETIRKNYMAIIYDHVNRTLGNKAGGQTQAQTGTNYGNKDDNQQQAQGPLNDAEKQQLADLNTKLKNNTISDEEKIILSNLLDRNTAK